jgi:hypothetical protein
VNNRSTFIACTICGRPRIETKGWFHLVENRWMDRVQVLRYHEAMAYQPGVFSVCCEDHVRELVVHWMITGELDFPLARLPQVARHELPRHSPAPVVSREASHAALLGELAVHRESLTRVLRTSPQTLSAVLEALISALRDSSTGHYPPPSETRHEFEDCAWI